MRQAGGRHGRFYRVGVAERKDRRRIVYTFLALLELIKLKMVKAYQTAAFGVIRIFPAVES